MRPAYSMWFWAALTVSAGVTSIVAPHLLAGAIGAPLPVPDSTLVVARLLGMALIGYGAGYGVAAQTDGRAFMRASVLLRASALPIVLTLVAIGWLPAPLLVLGLIDLAGALWTRNELRRRDRDEAMAANPAQRSIA